jgi:lipopolysaccharide/colanic/teichoic acid biosynthesis glycosyltransferase
VGDVIMSGAKKIPMLHLPMMRVDRYAPPPEFQVAKRALDIGLGVVLLLLFSPILLGAAIAVKLEDGGPVFYKQVRLTKDGREFNMLKFRSMVVSAEQDGVARLSTGEDDPRITRVGRFLRRSSIDELPQLFNVLRGDMSIVGPRPGLPREVAQYDDYARQRLLVLPGMTCYWQIRRDRNSLPFGEWLDLDLRYIREQCFLSDWKILLGTVVAVLSMDGV